MTDTTQSTDPAPSGNELVKTLDTATRGHHPDSPSSLQASEACPLFENEQRDSQASLDGTLQHKAAETRDLSILEGNESMIAAVQRCIDYEDTLIAESTRRFGAPPTVVREEYLSVGDDLVKDSAGRVWKGITGGFPDTMIVSADGSFIDIPDWKFGKVPVTPTRYNRQGQSYARAALEMFPNARAARVHFFAPHQQFSDAEHWEKYVATFDRESHYFTLENEIRTIVAVKHAAKKARDEKGDWSAANPCEDLCVFCANKGRCPKNLKLVLKVSEKHAPIEIPEHFGELEISTPDQVATAYRTANALEPVLKAIKKRCVELALQQDMVPEGWKLCRRQDREVSSLDDVVEAAKRHGVKKSEVYGVLTIPISKVEQLVKDKAEKGMGAAAVRGFSEALEKLGAVTKGPAVHFLQQVKTPAERPAVDQQEKAPVLDI
jgi:hypothetical protein